MNAEFHCFRAGVEPKWEDPECADGGKWSLVSSRKSNLESMWLETVSPVFILKKKKSSLVCSEPLN